ncbi:kinase-like domain-containing protein [Pelagophyceae sp. CCMP2097]|nr:kinase-like domain-containing protein [Pelagophyceae sp. CCMP2097]
MASSWPLDFRVGPRYAVQDRVGCGAHGEVVSACDSSGAVFAIKRLESRFDSRSLPFDFGAAKRALREVRLLRCLGHPNIVELLDIVAPPPEDAAEDAVVEGAVLEDEGAPPRRFSQVYLVTTLASTDLDRVLEAARGPGFALKPEQSVYLSYQLLCAVSHLASAGLLHRDVKPANLLIDLKTCQLRLCDFGLARAVATRVLNSPKAQTAKPPSGNLAVRPTQVFNGDFGPHNGDFGPHTV